MKRLSLTALSFALASVVACGDNNRANNANQTAARETGAAVGTTGAAADRDFIVDQLGDGRAEIELGKLASERATHPQVKEYARMIVRDHTTAGEELRQAATAANVQLDAQAEHDGDHKNLSEDLAKLSGTEFDRKYMSAMVDEHEEAVNEVEKKVESNNPQVRQWATKTLPTLRQHLDQAKQLRDTLEKSGNK
jgi:putative membrane protein